MFGFQITVFKWLLKILRKDTERANRNYYGKKEEIVVTSGMHERLEGCGNLAVGISFV